MLALLKPRAKKLTEYVDGLRPFLDDPDSYDAEAVAKHLAAPGMARAHRGAARRVYESAPFDEATLEQRLRLLAEARGVKAGTLIHATRIAMTGRMVSPGLFEMLVLLGRDRVVDQAGCLWRRRSHETAGVHVNGRRGGGVDDRHRAFGGRSRSMSSTSSSSARDRRGCVVAGRLSARPDAARAGLEAGGPNTAANPRSRRRPMGVAHRLAV